MIESVQIVGRGRVGSALAARLRDRGVEIRADDADIVVLCVPDRAIAAAAQAIEPGPWVGHVSGATRLAALDPHRRRFSLHPLQTFVPGGRPEQLDGAWAAVSAETDDARAVAFELDDKARPLYHAAAAIASNYLVTLYRTAAELFRAASAPPEALVPLMQRTIANGFELTGPIARGDWETVEAHKRAIKEAAPELEPVYDVLAEATAK